MQYFFAFSSYNISSSIALEALFRIKFVSWADFHLTVIGQKTPWNLVTSCIHAPIRTSGVAWRWRACVTS